MTTRKTGSSSNANKDPYAKFGFAGNEDCKKTYAEIEDRNKRKTLPLMTDDEWEDFCTLRRVI